MRIFIAGGTGVVGTQLVPLLVSRGHRVVATARTAEKAATLEAAGAVAAEVDGLDRAGVLRAVAAARPDVVVHQMTALADLAATGSVRGAVSTDAKIMEIAGPREESLVDAARRLVAHRGDALRIEEVSDAANPDHALYETGALLPGSNAVLAGPTFDAWLEATFR